MLFGAKVGLLDGAVAANLLRGSTGDDFSVHQNRDPIREIEDHTHVMLHHDQRARFRHLADQFDGLIRFTATHSGSRFIEQHDVRSARYGYAYFKRTLLGIGQHTGQTVTALCHANAFDNVSRAFTYGLEAIHAMPE